MPEFYKRLFKHWMRFTLRDAYGATFGWATVPGAAALVILNESTGIKVVPNPSTGQVLIYALEAAAVAWLVGFLVNALWLAPRKAYHLMVPFFLELDDKALAADFVRNASLCAHNVSVKIYNRSSEALIGCSLHVMDIPGMDGAYPRFIEGFDMFPFSERTVVIAYWFSRESPLNDDDTVGIAGPTSGGFGGNVLRVPSKDFTVVVRVQSQQSLSREICGRVWVDSKIRKLRGASYKTS